MGEKLSGPEIRATRLARALAAEHMVTLMAPGANHDELNGLPIIPFSRRRLLREALRHDVVMAATVPPFAIALKRQLGVSVISDQYDPVELELSTLGAGAERACATARVAHRIQLRGADLLLCAGSSQRQLLEERLKCFNEGVRPPVCTIPFGIDTDLPLRRGSPIRAHFPRIGPSDKIVLWWGSLWRWLDAGTAIRAVTKIASDRDDVKLVFTAGRPPNLDAERHSVLAAARGLATELGVLNRTVFFLDEWVPYERRGDFLQEADLGLTLHKNTEEAPLAARARYMDYLWAGLPCVLGRGDECANQFAASGFARLVEPGSPEETAATILAQLDDDAQKEARSAGRALAKRLRWDSVASPLLSAVSKIDAQDPDRSQLGLRPVTAYYLRRFIDRTLLWA